MYPDLQTLGPRPAHTFCFPGSGEEMLSFQSGPGCVVLRDPFFVGGANAVGKEAGYSSVQLLRGKKSPIRALNLVKNGIVVRGGGRIQSLKGFCFVCVAGGRGTGK